MAVLYLLEFADTDSKKYDAVMDELDLGTRPAEGALFHAAARVENNWQVVDIWESEAAFERFHKDRLRSALEHQGIKAPRIRKGTVHNTFGLAQAEPRDRAA